MPEDIVTMIPECIVTEKLMIKDSVMEECSLLQKINEASGYIENWVGWKTPMDYTYKCLTEGNLPPGGERRYYCMKSIYLKSVSKIIGVLEIYHGYPEKDSLCIGWLFIHPDYQKSGYAHETMKHIFYEAAGKRYRNIRLGVHLKNWPALRFWTSLGFDKIVKIVGDTEHSECTFASIILEKTLL